MLYHPIRNHQLDWYHKKHNHIPHHDVKIYKSMGYVNKYYKKL